MTWPTPSGAVVSSSPARLSRGTPYSLPVQRRLLWLAAGLVIIPGLVAAMALAYLRMKAIESGERLVESFAQVIEEQTTRTLQSVDQRLQLAVKGLTELEASGRLNVQSAQVLLREQIKDQPFLRLMKVIDLRGRVRYGSEQDNIGLDIADPTYFHLYITRPQTAFYIGPPVRALDTGRWTIFAARPLLSGEGKITGIVVAAIEPLYFDKLWRTVDLGDGGSISLFRRDGVLMMRNPFDEAVIGKSFQDRPLFKEMLPKNLSGSFHNISPIDQVSRLFSYRTLSAQPELVVLVGRSHEGVVRPWRHLVVLVGAIWTTVAVLVVVLCLFLSRSWRQSARMEADVETMAQRLILATDAASIGVWDWEIDHVDQWYATPTYFTMLGYDPEEGFADRKQWIERLHPDDRDAVEQKIKTVLAGADTPYQYEARMRHADGAYRWISVVGRVFARGPDGKASRMLGVRVDITERKRNEAALRQGQAFNQTILDSVTAEIAVLDNTGIIMAVNQPWRRFAQENSGDLPSLLLNTDVGANYLSVCQTSKGDAPNEASDAFKGVQAVLAGTVATFNLEYPCHSPTQERWFAMSVTPLGADGGGVVVSHTNITERKVQQRQSKLAAQVFTQSREGIMVTDGLGYIVLANQAFTDITGYSEAEVLGQNPRLLSSGQESVAFFATMWESINTKDQWAGELRNRRKDGTVYPQWLAITALRDDAGQTTHFVGSFSDLSMAKAAENRILWLSHFDPLTGLPNRALLQDRTGHAISMMMRSGEPLTMLLVGIDQFKSINDAVGHQVGDSLLVEMARRLGGSVREQDTVARLGGKEFVVLLPGTPSDGAAYLAANLLSKFAEPYHLGSHELNLTASIGVASYPDNGNDFETLLKASEIAMHRAQAKGRNTFQFYSEDMYQQVLARDHLIKALRNAIALDQLQVLYQPLVDLQTGQVSGMEALLRWHHPELGQVSPVQFIPLAEESGLIKGIGEWVLNQVCQDIRTWLDNGIAVPHVAVNVSPLQFNDADLVGHVKAALSGSRVDPQLVYLEVTESALMDDVSRSETILKELKGLGVKLSLDDFGTGYSSLSYLKRFPFDKVKIDQSFVRDITTSQSDNVIVKVIISMAHGLGLKVIAEGVETEAQCEIMRTHVCDEIQGYFFSKPISAPDIEALFTEKRQLPPHLLRFRKPQRSLLLVDDEPNVLASLKRLFRPDGHHILTASSGAEGLEILSRHKVDVIISDQRMPGMTGVEFLREAKISHPDTIRIVLSGYTELQSVTDAINEGAIYRFLTKPWDDQQLREHISKAFEYKELLEENLQLDIKIRTTNQELVMANRQLGDVLDKTRHQVERDKTSLAIVREMLQYVPLPVVGVDDEGLVAFVNSAAEALFAPKGLLVGAELAHALPEMSVLIAGADEGVSDNLLIDHIRYPAQWNSMGMSSRSKGKIVMLNQPQGDI